MPDNTKTFYFFNCLLDGAHIRTLWQAAFCFAETQVSILFVQVIFCLEVDPVSLYRKRKCIIVHSTIFAFQPECHSSIPKICKVGLVCCFCISAALLKIAISVKKGNFARFAGVVSEKYGSDAVTGMIRHQHTIYIF